MALAAENSDGGAFSGNGDGGISWIMQMYVKNKIKRNDSGPDTHCFFIIMADYL
jgi:hypothetical protein